MPLGFSGTGALLFVRNTGGRGESEDHVILALCGMLQIRVSGVESVLMLMV